MNKKGAELGINVVVIAAIVLLVLVVIAVLLFRSGGQLGGASECQKYNGICVNVDIEGGDTCASVLGANYGPSAYKCSDAEQTCCVKVGE